jgi:hypothetical protein
MKLSLSPRVYTQAFTAGIMTSMVQIRDATGLNYQTVMRLTSGLFAPQTFKVLAAYLECLGYTPDKLSTVRFGDIFEIREK